jgi:iron complex outermembrane receptor protein
VHQNKTNPRKKNTMLRKRPLALALGMIWSVAPMSVLAQQDTTEPPLTVAPPPPDAAGVLPEVLILGNREAQLERKNSDVQKIVISEEDVERYGDATVGDVLRRFPGMTFTGPAGVSKDVRMRGLDKGYTQFLINGEPVPGATQERQIQVDRLPADTIERIEIIRNPSAEYDAGGIGGTINIVLKNRADDMTRLRAAYGRNGDMKVGDVVAQWSRRLDDVDLIVALSHTVGAEDVVEDKEKYNAAGVVTEREHKPKPVEKSETLLAPHLTWRLGNDRLILDPFVSLGTEDKVESSEIRNGAGTLTKSSRKSEDKDDTLGRLSARYEGQRDWGNWYGKLGVQQGRIDKDAYTVEKNAAGVVNKRTQEDETVDEQQAYAGGGLSIPLGSAHQLKAGIEFRQTDYSKDKTVASANNATSPLTPTAPGANDIYDIAEDKSVVYLQDEWRMAENHWLTPGVRVERVEREATDRTDYTRNSTDTASNPSLHYRWAYNKDTNLRASVAQTLKQPKFDAVNPLVTSATGANTSTNPDKGGNADLKPEVATGFELGVEHFLKGNRGAVGLNFYNREVDDYIQKQTRLEGSRWVERSYNVGEARF